MSAALDSLLDTHAKHTRAWAELFVALDRFERCADVVTLRELATELADHKIDLTGDCPATVFAVETKIAELHAARGTHAEVIDWIAWAREEHGL